MMSVYRKPDKDKCMNSDIYVGVDVHERESQVAVFDKEGGLLGEKRMPTSSLTKYVSSLDGKKHVAVEAVGFIYPLYDQLKGLEDCTVSVASPSRLQLIAKSKLKNDKVDAKALGELLRTNYLPTSHMIDPDARERKLLAMERARYGRRRARVIVETKWLLKRRGIKVRKFDELKELHLAEIDRRVREMELLNSIIDELDNAIKATVATDKRAKLLDTIPGIAPYSALYLSAMLDDVERFQDSKHAAAYLGLVPSLYQSGDVRYTGHVTKAGDPLLRSILVQCARASIKSDRRMLEFYLRIKRKKGDKKAIIAVARKIVVYAYWILKKNVTYKELVPGQN
jgi:transposase